MNAIDLNFLSQSVSMNVHMFELCIELEDFFLKNSKNLSIVASNMKLFHEIKSDRFKKALSSHNLFCCSS